MKIINNEKKTKKRDQEITTLPTSMSILSLIFQNFALCTYISFSFVLNDYFGFIVTLSIYQISG